MHRRPFRTIPDHVVWLSTMEGSRLMSVVADRPAVRQGGSASGLLVWAGLGILSLAGAWLLRLLERSTPQARTIWTLVAVVVWAASFYGPLGARSLAAGLGLALLHAVVGSVVVIGLRRRHSDRLA